MMTEWAVWRWVEINDAPGYAVTLTRIGKRKLDSDNLQGGFKAIRDAIAKAFGIDDGSDRWGWRYDQRVEKRYGIEITIERSVQ